MSNHFDRLSHKLAHDIDSGKTVSAVMLLRQELQSNPREAMELIRQERERSMRNGSSTIIECKENGELFITNYKPASGYHSEGHYIGMVPRHSRQESRGREQRRESGDHRQGCRRQNLGPEGGYRYREQPDPRMFQDQWREYPRQNWSEGGYLYREQPDPRMFQDQWQGFPRQNYWNESGYRYRAQPDPRMFQDQSMGFLRFELSQQPYSSGRGYQQNYGGFQPGFRSMQPRLGIGIGLNFGLRF